MLEHKDALDKGALNMGEIQFYHIGHSEVAVREVVERGLCNMGSIRREAHSHSQNPNNEWEWEPNGLYFKGGQLREISDKIEKLNAELVEPA